MTIYERNCGATADFATHVNLRRSDVSFDSKKQEPIFVMSGRQKLQVTWLGKSSLLVTFPVPPDPKERVFQRIETVDGVVIRYEPMQHSDTLPP